MALVLSSCLLKPEGVEETDGTAAVGNSSSSTETGNSSSQSTEEADLQECVHITAGLQKDYWHTWVEINSRGQLDTVYESGLFPDESGYIGGKRVIEAVRYPGMHERVREISFGSVLACPGDSLYAWKDSLMGAALLHQVDTVYWNYGAQAHFAGELATPTVWIANKDEILADMDTLFYGIIGIMNSWTQPLLNHIPHDGADWRVEVLTPGQSKALQGEAASDIQCLLDNKANVVKGEEPRICVAVVDAVSVKILTTGSISPIEGDRLQWRLIASNRLGFADTLEVTSYLQGPVVIGH